MKDTLDGASTKQRSSRVGRSSKYAEILKNLSKTDDEEEHIRPVGVKRKRSSSISERKKLKVKPDDERKSATQSKPEESRGRKRERGGEDRSRSHCHLKGGASLETGRDRRRSSSRCL